jgi:Rrf2 family protein
MRLQKATRFALYAILELASHPDDYLSAAEIAEKYDISLNHLAKVMGSLRHARLVEASRGVGGGFRFHGNPKRITLMDLIQLFENIDPITNGEREPGDATEFGMSLRGVLEEIEDTARSTFSSITIDTMIKLASRQAERRAKDTARRQPAALGR